MRECEHTYAILIQLDHIFYRQNGTYLVSFECIGCGAISDAVSIGPLIWTKEEKK